MIHKLKILTVLDLVKDNKSLSLDYLYKELDIEDHFELDYLLFDAFSNGLISGKIDQKGRLLKVVSVKGRDYIENMNDVDSKIDKWIENLEKTSNYIMREVDCLRNNTNLYGEHLHRKANTIEKLQSERKI